MAKLKMPDMHDPKVLRVMLATTSSLLLVNSLALIQQMSRNIQLTKDGQELVDILTEASEKLGPDDWAKFANDFLFFQIISKDKKR